MKVGQNSDIMHLQECRSIACGGGTGVTKIRVTLPNEWQAVNISNACRNPYELYTSTLHGRISAYTRKRNTCVATTYLVL